VETAAITQIDFALEAERDQGLPVFAGDLSGLFDPFPSHHDDQHGRHAGRRADRAASGAGG
jgi:hypothetical protein